MFGGAEMTAQEKYLTTVQCMRLVSANYHLIKRKSARGELPLAGRKKMRALEKLKKFGYTIFRCALMVLFVSLSVTSCFDDSDIWDKIETIEEKLDLLETGLNNQIKAFSDFLADQGVTISECKQNADGSYSISLSNGTSFNTFPETADFSALP